MRLLAPAFVLASAATVPSLAQEPRDVESATLTWKGEVHALRDLPEGVFRRLCSTLEHWVPWVQSQEYGAHLSDDGTVVLVTNAEGRQLKRQLELVAEAMMAFDALLPAVEGDPEEVFFEAEWGVGEVVPDRDPIVLLELEEPEHFSSLLDHLGEEVPRLASWASGMKRGSGFMYDDVLSAAWMAAPPGLELGKVWRPQNELVNRLTRMLLRRRFGDQPHWFKLGVAWRVEEQVMGDVYAFPGRNEFVEVGSHTGWEAELKKEFKKRKREPLRWSEVARWRDGTWDADAAARAWGLVRFLAEHRGAELSAIAEALRVEHKAGARTVHADGRWELAPNHVVPIDVQSSIFETHAGDDLMDEATLAFQKGKRYRPRKRG